MTVKPDFGDDDWRTHVVDPDRSVRKAESERARRDMVRWLRAQAADRDGKCAWYVVAHRGSGMALTESMRAEGLNAWCPMRKVVKRVGRRRAVVDRKIPLFDGYVLVELIAGWEAAWLGVMTFDGVTGILGSAGRPQALPGATVEKLMEFEGLDAFSQGVLFARGRRVVITSGMFKGLEGHVVRSEDRNGELALELDLFGRLTPCRMGVDSVKLSD